MIEYTGNVNKSFTIARNMSMQQITNILGSFVNFNEFFF